MNTILDLGDFGEVEAEVTYNFTPSSSPEYFKEGGFPGNPEIIEIKEILFTFAGKDVQVDAEYLTDNSYEVLQDKISEYERWHQ